jgi:hypothetical protein
MRQSIKAALALAMVTGCAPDVNTVDRTQPNAIDKAQFEGIWYHRATITEADPEAGDTEGLTSTSEKIRWDIQEELLIAYRSYEFVPYAEGLTDEGRDFFGAPVAAFPILKHFDIQRDYNATTGVESNVIVENDTDRPWFERQYIRVDWSQNIVGRPTAFWTGWSNYPDAFLSGTSLARYYVQGHDETDINRPIFTKDYFDVTNIYSVEPDPYYCNFMLLYNQVPRCGLGNVKVRLSFRKVNPADDYESLYYPEYVELQKDDGSAIITNFDGRPCDNYDPGACTVRTYPMDAAFGNFRIMRTAFDRERFLTRTGRIYQAGRHNLWKDSFNDDGSTIPYDQREAKPVVYYANVQFPEEIFEPAQKMAKSYNVPFSQVVAFRKGYFTAEGAPDVARLRNEMGQDMFQFVKNDCNPENIKAYAEANGYTEVVERIATSLDRVAIGNVEQVCAAVQYAELKDGKTLDKAYAESTGTPLAFQWQRKGDLRYNFQNYITQLQFYGPWGVAQFGQDPETGMFYANAANYFGDAGDEIAQSEVDVIQWLNGDLTEEELFRGDVTRREVVSRRQNTNGRIRQDVKNLLKGHEDQILEEGGETLFTEGTPDEEDRRFRTMFGGSDVEKDYLVDDELLRSYAGPNLYQPFGAAPPPQGIADLVPGDVNEEAFEAARPSNWGITSETNPFMKAAYQFGSAGYDMADFFDPNTSGLAEFFKGEDRETIYQWMRAELFTAVNGHEVGHTVGLRHNFEASMDAQNYKPEFWWKQTDDGNVIQYWNNPPDSKNAHRGNELKYASIMDYAFDIPLEGFSGLGSYDEAAIRFQYGQIQEVWDSSKVSIPDPRKYGSFARRCGHDSDFWGLPGLLFWLAPEHIPVVLSQGAKDQSPCSGNYDTNTDCDSEIDALFRELVVRVESNAEANNLPSSCALFIGDINWLMEEVKKLQPNAQNVYGARKMVAVEDLIKQRFEVLTNPPEYDDVATDTVDESTDSVDNDGDGIVDDKSGLVYPDGSYGWSKYQYTVDYAYCSDLFANYSIPSCQRWDAGWDFEEATDNHINRWDRDYVFDHFRRDRLAGWGNPRSYIARLQGRRFFHMTNVFRYYLFVRRTAFEAPRFDDWREAAYKGLNFLERVLQTPEPGRYCLDATENKFNLDRSGTRTPCEQEFTVGLGAGQGRHLNTAWTDEYYYKSNRIGDFYDKLAAIQQMTTSSGRFVRDFSDLFNRRAYSLGYLRVYLDPMVQRWSAMITGDFDGYRSHVVTETKEDGTEERYVRYTPMFDEELPDGSSVRSWLSPYPEIEPSWSFNLRYYALGYALANWSSINDYAPEFYRFTKISIRGTPEDVDYPAEFTITEFTDPETFVTYRAPRMLPISPGGLISEFPAYYGDRFHRSQGKFHYWGIGGALLDDANTFLTDVWQPAKTACDTSADPTSTECRTFEQARTVMSEKVGFIDRVRRFNYRAEVGNNR